MTITPTPTTGATSPTTTPTTSASTTTAAAKPPSTYDEATALFATGVVDAAVQKVFTSPTGNIFCSIQTGGSVPAGCELRDGRVAAPADACPTGDAGAKDIGRIEWTDDTPKPICNSDSIYQVGAVVLQYGAIAAMPGSPFRCMSKEFGMTCVDTASKKGFFVARNTFVTLSGSTVDGWASDRRTTNRRWVVRTRIPSPGWSRSTPGGSARPRAPT